MAAAGGGRIAAPRRGRSGMSQLSFLTVEIAGQLVAILVDAVQAVLPMEEIVPVPLAPSRVVGIATKRGHVLTLIDESGRESWGEGVGEYVYTLVGAV